MAYKTILFENTNGTASITLNRPEKSNAMNRDMIVEIGDALDNVEKDD
ncbi:MAG: enoyl-CoA hydratase/isomerase family protein, partial [Deltaproteobacteria bacterium]|nr:enoyl-CoA hydratase/isomerase family protein [Deltaproteobacteria bacterium]